ncbi:MAG: hypothetical protein AAGH76_02540 [Pseudomonadota bacterium]
MNRATIEEQHIVDRYVQGKLTSDQQRDFEIFMLDNPDIADQVEYARGMQAALKGSADELFAGIDVAQRSTAQPAFFQSPTWAMAATVLLGVSLAWNVSREWQAPTADEPRPILQELWLEPNRSSGGTHEIAGGPRGLLINIDVAATPATAYRVALQDADGEIVWRLGHAVADADRLLRLVAPRFPTSNGTYSIVVFDAERPSQPLATYSLALSGAGSD